MKHQLRVKKQSFVTESVISVVSTKHQLRLKKQLFVTESVISSLYETPAEAEETVVCN